MVAPGTDLYQMVRARSLPFVAQPQYDIGTGKLLTGAVNPDLFDRLRSALADTRRINEEKRDPTQGDRDLDHVARGPGNIGDDCRFPFDQGIEQSGLAAVRRTTQHHPDAIPQLFRARPCQQAAHLLDQRLNGLPDQFGLRRRHIILVGKIQFGLDLRRQLQDPLLPLIHPARQRPACTAHGGLALQFGFGKQQVRKAFGFRQIDFAMGEGAAGKFPRFGPAQAIHLFERRFDRPDYRAPPMTVDLGQIFSGGAVRSRKP